MKVIVFVVVLFLIIVFNLFDFDRLLNGGTDDYIQVESGLLKTLCWLFVFVIIFDIKRVSLVIILYGSYIAIYTLLYLKIKKFKKEKEDKRRRNRE